MIITHLDLALEKSALHNSKSHDRHRMPIMYRGSEDYKKVRNSKRKSENPIPVTVKKSTANETSLMGDSTMFLAPQIAQWGVYYRTFCAQN